MAQRRKKKEKPQSEISLTTQPLDLMQQAVLDAVKSGEPPEETVVRLGLLDLSQKQVQNLVKKTIQGAYLPTEVRRELVKASRNYGLTEALATGDLEMARRFGNDIATEPEIGLTKDKEHVTIKVDALKELIEKMEKEKHPTIDLEKVIDNDGTTT